MREILSTLQSGQMLDRTRAREAVDILLEQTCSDAETIEFLTVTTKRIPSVEELLGYRDAMHSRARRVEIRGRDLVDMCGTGGDGKNTFNISTLTGFVVASLGIDVAKHGNYSASSRFGSSNLLEKLGIVFPVDEAEIEYSLERAGIAFLHAPLWHPALKSLKEIRSKLGFRTIFNLLGPLLNPCELSAQLIGVPNKDLQNLFATVLPNFQQRFAVVSSRDGHDEVALCCPTSAMTARGEVVINTPALGVPDIGEDSICGAGTIEEAADEAERLLQGKGSHEKRQVLAANAALVAQTLRGGELLQHFEQALDSLSAGAPFNRLVACRS